MSKIATRWKRLSVGNKIALGTLVVAIITLVVALGAGIITFVADQVSAQQARDQAEELANRPVPEPTHELTARTTPTLGFPHTTDGGFWPVGEKEVLLTNTGDAAVTIASIEVLTFQQAFTLTGGSTHRYFSMDYVAALKQEDESSRFLLSTLADCGGIGTFTIEPNQSIPLVAMPRPISVNTGETPINLPTHESFDVRVTLVNDNVETVTVEPTENFDSTGSHGEEFAAISQECGVDRTFLNVELAD